MMLSSTLTAMDIVVIERLRLAHCAILGYNRIELRGFVMTLRHSMAC